MEWNGMEWNGMERNDLIVGHRINWLLEQSKVPLRGTKDNSHAIVLRRASPGAPKAPIEK